ncbi:MAG: hypothetical protein U9N59_07135, partial [Campylobacterota bacterium]|nr:hypothetical protein [Campylobacterota bacterium]
MVIRFLKLIDNIRSLSNIKKYENENRNITIVFLSYRKQYIDSITTLEYLKEETKKMLIESYLLSLVKHATKRSWDLNVKSCDGFNLLSLAIYFGYDEIVNYIAKLDIDVNEKVTIKSDFDLFIKIENKDSLDLVFEENCEIYPIEIAARHYNTDIIKLLLKHGAKSVDNNIYDVLSGARQENGWSTIELIGAIGDADLIKHLLDNGYKNNIDELLQPATDNLKYEACKVLLECRDTSSPLVTYLGRPIIHKKIELLKLFVEHGIILDEKECIKSNELFTNSKSYLTICIECQDKEEDQITYYEIAQYLIENGVDLNYKNPLINTLKHKWKTTDESYIRMDHKMFYLLADNGADIHYVDEDTGETILMAVCRSSYFMDSSKVQKINKDNNFNITYFMNKGAVTEDLKDIKTNIIKYLINKGIDINIKDNDNNTALMAIETARAEHVVFIIDKNGYIYFDIDDNAESKYYYTEPKNAQIAKILIENGAKLNIKNNLGYTPLMIYSSRSGKAIIKYLLEQGANINTKIEVTASSLAQNEEIKEMIDDSKNNNPQRLVKLLSNFTIDKPIKYTTHSWDFGDLKKEYGNFDGYMSAVKKQFDSMKSELEELSPNLYKKISTFLIETTPDENYSW